MHLPKLRPLLAGLVAAVALAPPALAGPDVPTVPGKIAVEAGHKPFLVGHAVGVQIYTCRALPGGYAWSSATPRATLYDDHGAPIIHHYGGPSWQAKDGSTVVASRVDGVTVDAGAIPWLLLKATPIASAPDADRLGATTFIQRIATTGGLTPAAADCNAATAGTVREVDYTADYVFWKGEGA